MVPHLEHTETPIVVASAGGCDIGQHKQQKHSIIIG
jgi:hypothetical protein